MDSLGNALMVRQGQGFLPPTQAQALMTRTVLCSAVPFAYLLLLLTGWRRCRHEHGPLQDRG